MEKRMDGMRIVEEIGRASREKKKKQDQGRKGGKIEAHEEERIYSRQERRAM